VKNKTGIAHICEVPVFLPEGVKEMLTVTNIPHEPYDTDTARYIGNPTQAGRYMKHGAVLLDCFWSKDGLIFVFDKEATAQIHDKWCRYELE